MNSNECNWTLPKFTLENHLELIDVNVNYKTFGQLNEKRNNGIVVCHGLSGNSCVDEWWREFFKDNMPFDLKKYFIICANLLGSCYGTTGPASICQQTGKRYGTSFPEVTVRDSVNLHIKLVTDALGLSQVKAVIGGSLGGMQTLEWALLGGNLVKSIIPMSCGSRNSAWKIGINHLQRQAIYMDPYFQNGKYKSDQPPHQGLSLARQIAVLSYRNHAIYNTKFGRNFNVAKNIYEVESYLTYHGTKFLRNFDANSYITLLKMIDTHDVGRGRGGVQKALAQILQPTLLIAIDSDILYPLSEHIELDRYLPNSTLEVISSPHGHDGFLIEYEQVGKLVVGFLEALDK